MATKKAKTGNGVSGQEIHRIEKKVATAQKRVGVKVTGRMGKGN